MTDCSNSINTDEQQLIKLSLKKPKQWNWELTTSKSSSNISFPTIQLYDDDNSTLLVETNEANFSAGSKLCSKSSSVSKAPSLSKRSDISKSTKPLSTSERSKTHSPITIVELMDDEEPPLIITRHDLKTSKSSADCCTNNKEFRRYHRSSSSVRSRSSILKRIREFSEMAHEDETTDEDERETRNEIIERNSSRRSLGRECDEKKKYSMRKCNIGTIIIPKESFSTTPGRRRRRRSIDSEEKFTATAVADGECTYKKYFCHIKKV